MRTLLRALLLCLVLSLPFGDDLAQAATEPIDARARNAYVDAMGALAEGYQAAATMAVARGEAIVCPVPSATFVDSWGAPRSGGRSHQGVDMMAANGTPILAPAPGAVTFRDVSLGGLSFFLDGPGGVRYFGTHLAGYEGHDRTVVAGEVIGYVGATGNAGSPHLHFEIQPDGTAVNPYPATSAACRAPAPATETARRLAPGDLTPQRLAFCRFTTGGRIDYRLVRCLHIAAGYTPGTPGHTIADFRQEARQLRRFLAGLARPDCSGPADCPALIQRAFAHMGIAWRGAEAVRVSTCESGLNPRATNGSHDGLFQQADAYWAGRAATYGMAGRSAFDPWANAVVSAGMVRDTGGWSHWTCRP